MDAMTSVFPGIVVQHEDFESEKAFAFLDKYKRDFAMFNDDVCAVLACRACLHKGGCADSAVGITDPRHRLRHLQRVHECCALLVRGVGQGRVGSPRRLPRRGQRRSRVCSVLVLVWSKAADEPTHPQRRQADDDLLHAEWIDRRRSARALLACRYQGRQRGRLAAKAPLNLRLQGLITADRADTVAGKLAKHKAYFVRRDNAGQQFKTLEEVIDYVQPTALIGLSTTRDAFSEGIVRKMAALNKAVSRLGSRNTDCKAETSTQPIIFPLSNPTSKCELAFADALEW